MTPSCWRKPSSSLFDHFSTSMPSSILCVTVAVVSSLFPVLGVPGGDPPSMCRLRGIACDDFVPLRDLILDVVLAGCRDPEDLKRLFDTGAT